MQTKNMHSLLFIVVDIRAREVVSDTSAVYLAANGVEGKQDLGKARGEICKEYSSGL